MKSLNYCLNSNLNNMHKEKHKWIRITALIHLSCKLHRANHMNWVGLLNLLDNVPAIQARGKKVLPTGACALRTRGTFDVGIAAVEAVNQP